MTSAPSSTAGELLDNLTVIQQFTLALSHACEELETLNRAKGWYDSPRSVGDMTALLHDEVSEFFHLYRDHGDAFAALPGDKDAKPEGGMYELADVILRAMDTAQRIRALSPATTPSLGLALLRKYLYNRHRPYRHGNKVL